MTKLLVSCILLAASAVAQQKRIYIAPDDHTDYMWTGDEEAYRQAYIEMLDYYLERADKTQGNPPEFQSKWHADGTLWLWTYEHNKTAAEFARLMGRVKDGHISVPLNALVSTYGGTPAEAVLRGMYYAGSLERRFGVKLPMAIAMEDQTLPYGLGALWAGAGAKYSWKGICGCLTKIPRTGQRPHEIYWWKGDDGSRILMKWNSMLVGTSGARTMGGYAEARTPEKEVGFVDTDPGFHKVYPWDIVGVFGKGWDDLKTMTDEFVTTAQKMTTAARKVIVSNMTDFFVDFEKSHGKELPEFSASFGNEWDLYTASVAEVSAKVRRAVEKLRAAEALATVVSLQRPEFLKGREAAREQAWMNLGLFWEHNWTADGKTVSREERAAWGRRIAGGVERYVDDLHSDAAYALGGLIRGAEGKRRFYVFNPLGWVRTDFADVAYDGEEPVHVVEVGSGLEVPSQMVTLPGKAWRRYLRIQATDLPAVGYKTYEVRDGAGRDFGAAATAQGNVLENAVYRLRLEDRGAIRSLVDKQQGNREFAGSLDNGRLFINDLGLDPGRLEVENAGAVSVTVMATGSSPLAHVSRITLFRDSRRIDIRNEITEGFDATHTWSFSFNLKNPDVRHEEVGAIVRAKLLAEGGVYSPTMSRLDWLTLNHFADMSGDGGAGVTLSNSDLAFMKLGDSDMVDGVSRLDVKTPQIQVLAGGRIDAPRAGIAKQGGDRYFLQRFALQTHTGYDATRAMKFALEHQNPLVAAALRPGEAKPGPGLPETRYSLASVSNPEVVLWALKPSEDGIAKGIVTRVWNMSTKPQEYFLTLAEGIRAATRTSHIETDIGPITPVAGKVAVRLEGSQMQTMRVQVR